MISNRDKQAKMSDFDCLKHPGKFTKSLTNRMLRRDKVTGGEEGSRPWPSQQDARGKIKRSGICPLCLERLQKIARGTRYEKLCRICKGMKDQERVCPYCDGREMWVAADGARAVCKRCGKEAKQAVDAKG